MFSAMLTQLLSKPVRSAAMLIAPPPSSCTRPLDPIERASAADAAPDTVTLPPLPARSTTDEHCKALVVNPVGADLGCLVWEPAGLVGGGSKVMGGSAGIANATEYVETRRLGRCCADGWRADRAWSRPVVARAASASPRCCVNEELRMVLK